MAKGQIVDSLDDGLYRVRLLYAVDRVQRELAKINSRIAELAVEIPEAKLARIEKEDEAKQIESNIDQWIALYQTDPETARDGLIDIQKTLARLAGELKKLDFQLSDLIVEDLSLKKRRGQLQNLPETKDLEAWCADYTTDLTGEVGIVQINDEGGGPVLIHPGFEGAAAYDPARDGQVMAREAQSGAQVYFNAAILPGVQKWRPRYRLGQITAIDGDACSVRLDDARSSAQGLEINQSKNLTEVPIQYMECDGDAFEDGDRVVVRFFTSGPQVIGFEGNPRPCVLMGIYMVPTFAVGPYSGQTYGEPFFDQNDDPINPPLGESGGMNPAWALTPGAPGEGYSIQKGVPENVAGNLNWIQQGGSGLVLSWHGPVSRYFEFYKDSIQFNWQSYWSLDTKVFCKLSVLVDMDDYAAALGNRIVLGAAADSTTSPASLFIVTVSSAVSLGPEFKLWHFDLNSDITVGPIASLEHTYQAPADTMFCSGFYFDGQARNAICTLRGYYLDDIERTDRERVYALRLSVVSGFSLEKLYDADDGVGQNYRTVVATRNDDGENNTGTATYDSATVEIERDLPIYLDFIGGDEVTVYHRRPQKIDVRDFDYEKVRNGDVEEKTSSDLNSETSDQAEKIVTSQGVVLASVPGTINNYNNLQNYSYADLELSDFSYSMTLNIHRDERNAGGEFEHLVINARDQFVAMVYSRCTFDGRWSREGENQDADLESDGTLGGLQIELYLDQSSETVDWTLDVWQAGSLVHRQMVESSTEAGAFNRFAPQSRFGPFFEETAFNTNFIGKPVATPIISTGIQDAAMVKTQNRTAISVLFFDSEGNPHKFQRLDGEGDPAGSIFERDPSQPYIMHRLTLY